MKLYKFVGTESYRAKHCHYGEDILTLRMNSLDEGLQKGKVYTFEHISYVLYGETPISYITSGMRRMCFKDFKGEPSIRAEI